MMGVDELVSDIGRSLKKFAKEDITEYEGNPAALNQNRRRTAYGAAALGIMYLMPRDHPLLTTLAAVYTGIKGYQALRDWWQTNL